MSSNSKKNSHKPEEEYDDVGYFCGCFRKKSKMEQSKTMQISKVRHSMNKSDLDGSKHYASSQLNLLNSTNSESQRKVSVASPIVSSFAITTFENNYLQNQLFLLRNNQSGESIFAKITQIDLKTKKIQNTDLKKSRLFEQKNDNEQILNNNKYPELTSKYIASRIKEQITTLAEYGCGNGENTVQFTKYLDFVIAIDKNTNACLQTKQNCDQSAFSQELPNPKVEIINADIFKLKKNLPFDSIFINPTMNNDQQICKDIIKDCSPNLKELLNLISDQIENLIIQFPAQMDYSQLPLLLNINQQYRNNNKQQSFIAHCSLEIEKIYIQGKHIYNIVYYGKVANISREELKQLLTMQMANSETNKEGFNKVVAKLNEKIGSLDLIYELLQAQSYKYSFDQFLIAVCEKYKLDYNDYAFMLYQKLSKDYSQNTFNYKLRDSNNAIQESQDFGFSPKFSYSLNGLSQKEEDCIAESQDNLDLIGLNNGKQNQCK
ncbi:unnamed protein product [Paramecium primaurelia]|uniref:Trimethylguanosine synthase n=1 Tax=Paramecium primaurelia TaxID=5886 RepID=A0A8S1NJ98_PARPR|nr:unnamed protein product [Paramecium primaurelia]